MNIPRTISELAGRLQDRYELLEMVCRMGEPDFFGQLELAEIVEEANRLSCRFGGPLVCEEHATMTPRRALEAVGKLLAWARERGGDDLGQIKQQNEQILTILSPKAKRKWLSVEQAAERLDRARAVQSRASAGPQGRRWPLADLRR
jgi:hypothetical protein